MTKFGSLGTSSTLRRMKGMAGKAITVGALTAAAVAVVSPVASASNQEQWVGGCRGYWYNTAFHGYCENAQGGNYSLWADCSYQIDFYGNRIYNPQGYTGTFDSGECSFKVTNARVSFHG